MIAAMRAAKGCAAAPRLVINCWCVANPFGTATKTASLAKTCAAVLARKTFVVLTR